MGFRINTNVAAMYAHMNALNNNRELDKSLERLSSGLRINKAADDASGMTIANQLKSQSTGLGQAIRNANDGINLAQTADGALEEYTNILNTIRTKAIQAASDEQTADSRKAIQKDIDKLLEEAQNIAKTTSFNGQKLLSGAFSNRKIQIGANSHETVALNIADARINKVGVTTRGKLELASDGGKVDLTLTNITSGKKISLKEINIQYNNDPQSGIGALADEINKYTDQTGIKAHAVVSSTTSRAIKAGETGDDFAINGINIGKITVQDNDNDNALVNAINEKTNQTGVVASLEAGKLTLTSVDGRAIKVEGDVSDVMGTNAQSMSTIGHLELVQEGASDFLISANGAGATGADLTLKAAVTTSEDSIVAAGSTLKAGTTFAKGSVIGGNLSNKSDITTTEDSLIKAGSNILKDSTIKQGTVLGGTMSLKTDTTIKDDTFLTAGSILEAGSVLGKGTVITTEFSQGGKTYKVGDILDTAVTLKEDLALKADMTLKFNGVADDNSQIKANSILNTGSRIGADVTNASDMKIAEDMSLKAGSTIKANSEFKTGSSIGAAITAAADVKTTIQTSLEAGSKIEASSTLAQRSNLGANVTLNADVTLKDEMNLKAGTILKKDSVIAKGTLLTQDIDAADGKTYKAGTVLSDDISVKDDTTLTKDMRVKENSVLKAGSTIAKNTDNEGGVEISDKSISNLSDIDVTTLDGAMKAIDTLDAALKQIDKIRSNIGSTQNQLESTIRNISVTKVNLTAAESTIRDVDFAEESANLKKRNILAQSGVYAMSQANAVQQNVTRLLQ